MTRLCTCAIILTIVSPIWADDADQFRGPGATGVSKETNLPVKWSATENVRWKTALPGRGLSNPVIARGRVYVTASAAYQQKREVVCQTDAVAYDGLAKRPLLDAALQLGGDCGSGSDGALWRVWKKRGR